MLGKLIKGSLVFAAGAAVGAGMLWLMSEDGKETREKLRDIAEQAKQKMEEGYEQAKQKMEEGYEQAKQKMEECYEQVKKETEVKDETADPA